MIEEFFQSLCSPKCNFGVQCFCFRVKVIDSVLIHSHIWNNFFMLERKTGWSFSLEELLNLCGWQQLFLEQLLLLDQHLSSPDDISAGYVICFFADCDWEPSCERVKESNAIVFLLPPHQQARVVSDPTGMLLSGKEIKFSAPRFPKVIMQSLAKTTQERKQQQQNPPKNCIEVADDYH